MLHAVVIAGGYGSRLWPLSRELHPKQFIPLVKENISMLQDTCQRLKGVEMAPPLIICNEQHRFLAAEQLRQIGLEQSNIILEPEGRNTAPAIALAALNLCNQEEDPILLVLAADHFIQDINAFQGALNTAVAHAVAGKLVTFGIVPIKPETGYGYIKQGKSIGESGFLVDAFVEKPDISTAETYVAGGLHYWNSGMFMFRAKRYLEELEIFRPDILEACRLSLSKGAQDLYFTRVDKEAFLECPDESIDYAVMEHTDQAVMVTLDAGWCDVGSWSALWELGSKDEWGNVSKGDVICEATSDSYIHSDHRLVATLGVKDLVIVETKDAVLIADKSCAQDVKTLISRLKSSGRNEHVNHREVYRPWGVYDSVDAGHRYQVKRITVKPGAKLSVQMHHHRAEHWIVVSGTAKVTNGEKVYLVTENQSTFIPIGQVHALENPGVIPLELIEVQSGSYLGENDIVRFEDKYGRV
ncbi:mannose-1-phosphate guanylyltransferase/mannose-6-phosphate isomerase [Pseudomonas sp. SD17-1]|uniref:mannose-1-phosphate guanylyltransferase/mannose-6-phosphate isomerase n=1 Tax=Pseudomonas sp. SD17-1 TaxID=2976883 RepID=UPI0023DA3041|nr:mannose-1-phosphate guanylyltransferase/mannose-6-phosphate isomerase [Pseudomonas sp. SD17-1]WEJ20373.1 mannose-1-phosphate guanylyltransferase/mannose-6-phosphate isomerase [Pseudomonas sp. SD17-1]